MRPVMAEIMVDLIPYIASITQIQAVEHPVRYGDTEMYYAIPEIAPIQPDIDNIKP